MARILRGDTFFWADLNPTFGSKQQGIRPVLMDQHVANSYVGLTRGLMMGTLSAGFLSALLCSNSLVAGPVANQKCFVSQFQRDSSLLKQISSFPNDNRAILEENFEKFGLSAQDLQQIKPNLSLVSCPGTKWGNPGNLSGSFVEKNNIVVTNLHAFRDERGRYREPLSECTITTQEERAAHLPGHKFFFGSGADAFLKAQNAGKLYTSNGPVEYDGYDWVALQTTTSPKNVTSFKLADVNSLIHKCRVEQPTTCQKVVSITAYDDHLKDGSHPLLGKSVIQSANLYNFRPANADMPTRYYSELSTVGGESAALNFIADEKGVPIRIDGQLVLFALTVSGPPEKDNGKSYDPSRGVNRVSVSVGLDGPFAVAVHKLFLQ